MRPLDKVIDATLKLVPKNSAYLPSLEKEFAEIKERYSAKPESAGDLWFHFVHFLATTLGEPDVAWKEEIASLLQGKKDYIEVLNA
jgi:hypothetical protein